MSKHVAIFGGGITGLATAYALQSRSQHEVKITLLESNSQLGGRIKTQKQNGFVLEGGPDSFLAGKKSIRKMIEELGLDGTLLSPRPESKGTYIWYGDRLHRFPMGVLPMITSQLISWPGKIRMGMELLIPPQSGNEDESLASFITRRFGTEALDKMAGPLIAGIYSADATRLSIRSSFSMLPAMESSYGGVLRGLIEKVLLSPPSSQSGSGISLLTPVGGMQTLPDAIAQQLPSASIRLNSQLNRLTRDSNGYKIELTSGEVLVVDAVVMATPAHAAADLVSTLDTSLSETLRTIPYASTATMSLGYRSQDLPDPTKGSGFMVPRKANRGISACTWTSQKFSDRAPEGHSLLRVFVGGRGLDALAEQSEEQLIDLARLELRNSMGIEADPVMTGLFRWTKANPQYEVGHATRVAQIEKQTAKHPGLYLAGSAYYGAGISDCIESASRTVDALLAGESTGKERSR